MNLLDKHAVEWTSRKVLEHCKAIRKTLWDKTLNYIHMAVVFISTDVLISGEVLTVPQNQWLVRQLPSSRFHHWWKWQVRSYTLLFLIFTDTSEAMVVLHTHFTLLYLRGGLCWDCGLACRRSTAIFTSENKSIQTLNITVTCKSIYAFTQNGVAASTLPRSKWNWAPLSELEIPNWTK